MNTMQNRLSHLLIALVVFLLGVVVGTSMRFPFDSPAQAQVSRAVPARGRLAVPFPASDKVVIVGVNGYAWLVDSTGSARIVRTQKKTPLEVD